MTFIWLCLPTILGFLLPDNEIGKSAVYEAQAVAYFEALTVADVEAADNLVAAPYSFDRKKTLQTKQEVHDAHESIVKNKGKRPIPKYAVSKTDKAPPLDMALFPKYVVYRVMIDDEHVDIYLTIDESPKVIGFSD